MYLMLLYEIEKHMNAKILRKINEYHSPSSLSSPPIRGRHKSGAVPAYLDTTPGHSHTALLCSYMCTCTQVHIYEWCDMLRYHHLVNYTLLFSPFSALVFVCMFT